MNNPLHAVRQTQQHPKIEKQSRDIVIDKAA
jgi:hypothetical protein